MICLLKIWQILIIPKILQIHDGISKEEWIKLPKISQKRKDFVKSLMDKDLSYDQIQEQLKDKFGEGMSNTTLQKIKTEMQEIHFLKTKIQHLEEEVKLWKKMYFELKDATIKQLQRKSNVKK